MQTGDTPERTEMAAVHPMECVAYRVACGPWLLAFDLAWTTGISETFSLHPVPRAPVWLVGCTNADGLLVPVVDMLLLLDPHGGSTALSRRGKGRLVLGSHSPGDNEETLGLLFAELPQQISYAPMPIPSDPPLPPALQSVVGGAALSPDGHMALEIDTRSLVDLCVGQLEASGELFVNP